MRQPQLVCFPGIVNFKFVKFFILSRRNRGKQPNDDKWFAPKWHPVLKDAVDDFGYLRSRHYSDNSILRVVGDRYKLNKRQRIALLRIAAGRQEILSRGKSMCRPEDLQGQDIGIDGFNLLILLESALSGAFVFKARDGTYRDISSVHGSYKRVVKTEKAILLTGEVLKELGVNSVMWYLDKPVSNSGRLKILLREISEANGFNWQEELVYNPDAVLAQSDKIVVTTDSWILDQAKRWFNLGGWILERHIQEANVIEV